MEVLRFGSRIPGTYWGCCAIDIIQNFKFDPDEKASIQMVTGDAGQPILRSGEEQFLGMTYREIFWSRIRLSTFSTFEHPNHAFLAIMTDDQIHRDVGAKWLKILHEAGFEFIRAFQNSVYTGSLLDGELPLYDEYGEPEGDNAVDPEDIEENPNYLFGLFHNIGAGRLDDVFTPPLAWKELGKGCPTVAVNDPVRLTSDIDDYNLAKWKEMPPACLYTKAQLEAAGVPVHYAGKWGRLQGPKEPEAVANPSVPAPFAATKEDLMPNA